MQVDIVREPKYSKIDHLFVLVAEGTRDGLPDLALKAIRDAKFEGRCDESITLLNGAPRKLTLIGLGQVLRFSNDELSALDHFKG